MAEIENTEGIESRVLIMTPVPIEQEAVRAGLGSAQDADIYLAGVGSAAAAASTAKKLAERTYDYVVNAGIAGGFTGQAEIGSLVVATKIIAADLGAETNDGFNSLEELGFGQSCFNVDAALVSKVTRALQDADFPVYAKPVLTLSTVTGTQRTTNELKSRFPEAGAEAMEGFGVAQAASLHGIPVLELRAISNVVGPRNRESWRIEEALRVLTRAMKLVMEELK